MNSFVIVVLALVAAAQANAVNRRLEVEDRIVGGEIAVPHSYPYQAFLFLFKDETILDCGGTLLTTTTVLTAAHCVPDYYRIVVLLGIENLSMLRVATTQARYVAKRKVHKGYNSETYANDIAILILESPAELNEYVQLTTLPTRADVGKTYVGELATVSGWGRTSNDPGVIPDFLRFFSSPIVSNEDCSQDHGHITPTQICIDGKLMKGTCTGDGGGPLVVGDNRVQVGIVSKGKRGECATGFAGIYTRVTEYLDWIATNGGVQIN